MEDNPHQYDIPIWFNGTQNWMTGLTKRTTCDDLIYALLYSNALHETDATESYAIFEKWREVERPLSSRTKVLKVWSAWGEEQPNVQLSMRSLDDYFLPGESSLYLRSRRRGKKPSRHKVRHTTQCRCHNKRGCVECSRLKSLEQLVKLVVNQERKIQEISDRIYDTDVLIGRHESRIHHHRVQQNGQDYVQDSYLNSRSSESSSSLDRLSFTSLDLKDIGEVFPESTYHELEEISRLCNDLTHVERRLEEERAKIEKLEPEVDELSQKMGLAAEKEGETNLELEDTRTEMIRAVTMHVTNEYNERELDRKLDVCLHQLAKKMELYRELNNDQVFLPDASTNPRSAETLEEDVFLPRVHDSTLTSSTDEHQNTHTVLTTMSEKKDLGRSATVWGTSDPSVENLCKYPLTQSPLTPTQEVSHELKLPYQKKSVTFAGDNDVETQLLESSRITLANHNLSSRSLSSSALPPNHFHSTPSQLASHQSTRNQTNPTYVSPNQNSPSHFSPNQNSLSHFSPNQSLQKPFQSFSNEQIQFSPNQNLPTQNSSDIKNNSSLERTSDCVKGGRDTVDNGRDYLDSRWTSSSEHRRTSIQTRDGLKIRSRSADRSSEHQRARSRELSPERVNGKRDSTYMDTRRDSNIHIVNQYGLELAKLPGHLKHNINGGVRSEHSRFNKTHTPKTERVKENGAHEREVTPNKGENSQPQLRTAPDLPSRQPRNNSTQSRNICAQGEQSSLGVSDTHDTVGGRERQGEQLLQPNNANNRILTNMDSGSRGDNIPQTQRSLLRGLRDSSIAVHNKGHLFGQGISDSQRPSQNNGQSALQANVNKSSGQRPELTTRAVDSKVACDPTLRSVPLHHGQVQVSSRTNASLSDIKQIVDHSTRHQSVDGNALVNPINNPNEMFPHKHSHVLPGNQAHARASQNSSALINMDHNHSWHDHSSGRASESPHAFPSHYYLPRTNQNMSGSWMHEVDVHEINTWTGRSFAISAPKSATASDDESISPTSYGHFPETREQKEARRPSVDSLGERNLDHPVSSPGHYRLTESDSSSRGALYHIVTSKLNKSAAESSQNFTREDSRIYIQNGFHPNSPSYDITKGHNVFDKDTSLGKLQTIYPPSDEVHLSQSKPGNVQHNGFQNFKHIQDKGNNPSFHNLAKTDSSYLTLFNGTSGRDVPHAARQAPFVNSRVESGCSLKQNHHRPSPTSHQSSTASSPHLPVTSSTLTVNLKDIPANHQKTTRVMSARNYGNTSARVLADRVLGRTKFEDNNDSNSDTGLSSMHSDETANLETLV
ncbi:ras association domain-containing protein 9 [Biomphalaria glabrata]|nr:ras association domain-containing protein 9-like [Biomphalaria glabrata]